MEADSLATWLARQAEISTQSLRSGISATHLVKERPAFGQAIRPQPGSVVASTAVTSGDGEPDYFFHWLRDSALVMDVVSRLAARAPESEWPALFAAFVDFSLSLSELNGSRVPMPRVTQDHVQFLRPGGELRTVDKANSPGDVRFNPDGTIDILQWSRPQHDGPALRALACLRHRARLGATAALDALIELDLAFTLAHAGAASFDPWEESRGRHYYTLLAQASALEAGTRWAEEKGATELAAQLRSAASQLLVVLEGLVASDDTYRPSLDARPEKTLDMAVVLAALHAPRMDGRHSLDDSRLHATLAALERQFADAYPINHRRSANTGVAFGRYIGDKYIGCGPWYICTFAAAEFRYRAAARARTAAAAAELIEAGDAVMRQAAFTIRRSGGLSEQFSPDDGRQLSVSQLGWSDAALLTAAWAREEAKDAMRNDRFIGRELPLTPALSPNGGEGAKN